jgi:A/G-specific adenine glycosylase
VLHPFYVIVVNLPKEGPGTDIASIRAEYILRGLTPQVIQRFRRAICSYYWSHGRELPWRSTTDPYCILVSEFMLQQTRVERVGEYYPRFIERFPDFTSLGSATLPEVLRQWRGLGYNRRARALRDTAWRVSEEYDGNLPSDEQILLSFPGIGHATAGAIRAFAFNQPAVFLETNIRTVYIFFFLHQQTEVTDRDILPLLEATIPPQRIRDWYYALMDYGVLVKKYIGNLNRQMRSYRPPPLFAGSDRQIRGRILSLLMECPHRIEEEIRELLDISPSHLNSLLTAMEKEGLLTHQESSWFLTR